MFKPIILAAQASLAAGCALLKPTSVPIASEYYRYQPSNSTLIVLLHGCGGAASNFVKYGAVEQIAACQPGPIFWASIAILATIANASSPSACAPTSSNPPATTASGRSG